MLISPALAQTAGTAAAPNDFLISLLPFVLIFIVMYFLIIRPQRSKMKQHEAMVKALRRNDVIVTLGGLVGKVKKVGETEIDVELNPGNIVKVVKGTLSEVRAPGVPKPAND